MVKRLHHLYLLQWEKYPTLVYNKSILVSWCVCVWAQHDINVYPHFSTIFSFKEVWKSVIKMTASCEDRTKMSWKYENNASILCAYIWVIPLSTLSLHLFARAHLSSNLAEPFIWMLFYIETLLSLFQFQFPSYSSTDQCNAHKILKACGKPCGW